MVAASPETGVVQPTLDVNNLSIRYGSEEVLGGVSLEVRKHEIFGIIGPANAGKTSFLKAINRMDMFTPTMHVEGDIRFNGREIRRLKNVYALRSRIGVVFPLPVGLPMTVYENVALAPRLSGVRDRKKLEDLRKKILQQVPGAGIAADQAYRDADLAIDFCEDVAPLPRKDVKRIVRCFKEVGAEAKISSIHVNGWFGAYDKLSMTRLLFKEIFRQKLDDIKSKVIYIGDSPNDVPMFAYFTHSVGVANISSFKKEISCFPAWITQAEGGQGFAEMVAELLA